MWGLSISSHPVISTWGVRHEDIQNVNSANMQYSKVGSTSGHAWEQSRRPLSKISPENADTVSQADMLPKQSFQYLLSSTFNTKVLLWMSTTTFCHWDFSPVCWQNISWPSMYVSSQKVKDITKWCHITVRPENEEADGGTSFRKPWTSCSQAALESEAAYLESTVSLLRGRDQQLYMGNTTLLRGEQHLSAWICSTHYRDTTRGAGPVHPAPCSAVQHRKASHCSRLLHSCTGSMENVQNLNS